MAEFSSKQNQVIAEARQNFTRTGFPEKAAALNALVAEGAPFSKIEALIANKGQSTASQPPLSGKGSGVEAWREYAVSVTDLDPETAEDMSKEDLVEILTDQGFIAKDE